MAFYASPGERPVAGIRAAVADTFRQYGDQQFQTIERIEDYSCNDDVANLPTAGNVFGAIAGALEGVGVFGDYSTVGGVIKKLIDRDQYDKIQWIAHHLGCACAGVATGEMVAGKIRTLGQAGRPKYEPGPLWTSPGLPGSLEPMTA